jgi:hypothetical protein
MKSTPLPGGTFTLADGLTVTRMGYGAMQLAGAHVFGPPADRDAAVAVLREAVPQFVVGAPARSVMLDSCWLPPPGPRSAKPGSYPATALDISLGFNVPGG